jgi:hypothetical protein
MTTVAVRPGHYGFRQVARMEWIKLRSLRSTWLTLALTVASAVGVAAAVGAHTKDASSDLTNNALGGIAVGLLLTGVLGVLTMTSEYTSGMIRATLTAIPNRPLLLTAKAAVFAAVALATGEVASFIAFFAGSVTLPGGCRALAAAKPLPGVGGSDDRAHVRPWFRCGRRESVVSDGVHRLASGRRPLGRDDSAAAACRRRADLGPPRLLRRGEEVGHAVDGQALEDRVDFLGRVGDVVVDPPDA